ARTWADGEGAGGMLGRLWPHHSRAINEATERGRAGELAAEFRPARRDLDDALIYCDMTTSPDGDRLPVACRLAEIRRRYGPGHLVSRSITRSAPELIRAVDRISARLAECSPTPARPAGQGDPLRVLV